MKKNVVKISESQLRQVIAESVNKTLKEVSDRTIGNALDTSSNYNEVLDEIGKKFEDLKYSLADIADCGWNNVKPVNNEDKRIYDDLSKVFERFKQFRLRKQQQYSSFEDEYISRGRPEID
jgi:hypothetical protein